MTSFPSTVMTPDVGSTMRLIIRSEVVLPQPDGPTKTVIAAPVDGHGQLVHGRVPALILLGDALELNHGLVHCGTYLFCWTASDSVDRPGQ